MLKQTIPAFAAGIIVTATLAGGTAVAATGGKFILGKANSASSTTTLKAARGPALSLSAKGPALKVNSEAKIPRLNADKIDGLDSSAFARRTAKTGSYDVSGFEVDLDGNGIADTLAAFADCPAGTQMTGGGGVDLSSTGYLIFNTPQSPEGNAPVEGWIFAVGITEGSGDLGQDVNASVVCWSPNGSMPAGSYKTTAAEKAAVREHLRATVTPR